MRKAARLGRLESPGFIRGERFKLHDIGLVKEFDSHTVPFEEVGGHLAWVFAAGADWPVERRVRASEVDVRAAGPGPGRRSGQAPEAEAEAGPVLWTTSNDQSWDPVAAGP
ncbi:hypothetical protein AB0B56_29705 [Streptosporangium canum]|uniref:hypothetical protein n=1 Tax=Streptosporangium canum TaxID=324952 RepID=UPI0034365AC2